MKQNILIATLLAGMLALAGCGGGSSSSPANDGGMKDNGDTEPKTLDVSGLTGVTLDAGKNQTVKVKAEAPRDFGNKRFTCEEGTCEITFTNELGTIVAEATGDVTVADKPTTPIDITTGTNPQPTVSTDPLSNDVLVKAFSSDMAERTTVWNTNKALPGSAVMYTPLSGPKIHLWSGNDSGVFWGHWGKSTMPLDTDVFGNRGTVFGGSKPYGKKPDASLMATYTGGGALFYYSTDGTKWVRDGTGNVAFTANFKTGYVGGDITPTAGLTMADKVKLEATTIGNDGMFSGSASFDADTTRDNGSWEGGFFGDTTMVTLGVQAHKAPSHVAGKFNVSRPKHGTDQTELHIRGAFGTVAQ